MKKLIPILFIVISLISCEKETYPFSVRFSIHCPLAFKYAKPNFNEADLNEKKLKNYCDCFLENLIKSNPNNRFINGHKLSYKPYGRPLENIQEVYFVFYSSLKNTSGYKINTDSLIKEDCRKKYNIPDFEISKSNEGYSMIKSMKFELLDEMWDKEIDESMKKMKLELEKEGIKFE